MSSVIDKQTEWVIPAELRKPPPRRVQRRIGTLSGGTVFARIAFFPIAVAGVYLAAQIPFGRPVATTGELTWKPFVHATAVAVVVACVTLGLFYVGYLRLWQEKRLCSVGTPV